MSMGRALKAALADFYRQSWRLVLLNSAFSIAALAVVLASFYSPFALVLIVFLGPLALALMHCTVTLAQTEELNLEDGLEGLRLHWKRGLALGAMTAAVLGLGAFAIAFYAGRGPFVFPLAVVVFYLLAFFALFQMWLWPLAVLERDRPFGEVMRDAARGLVVHPLASVGLALALFVVNALAAAAAILPLLTLSIAFTFLAAAHFVLPPRSREG
jgi:hypothetical protein